MKKTNPFFKVSKLIVKIKSRLEGKLKLKSKFEDKFTGKYKWLVKRPAVFTLITTLLFSLVLGAGLFVLNDKLQVRKDARASYNVPAVDKECAFRLDIIEFSNGQVMQNLGGCILILEQTEHQQ